MDMHWCDRSPSDRVSLCPGCLSLATSSILLASQLHAGTLLSSFSTIGHCKKEGGRCEMWPELAAGPEGQWDARRVGRYPQGYISGTLLAHTWGPQHLFSPLLRNPSPSVSRPPSPPPTSQGPACSAQDPPEVLQVLHICAAASFPACTVLLFVPCPLWGHPLPSQILRVFCFFNCMSEGMQPGWP